MICVKDKNVCQEIMLKFMKCKDHTQSFSFSCRIILLIFVYLSTSIWIGMVLLYPQQPPLGFDHLMGKILRGPLPNFLSYLTMEGFECIIDDCSYFPMYEASWWANGRLIWLIVFFFPHRAHFGWGIPMYCRCHLLYPQQPPLGFDHLMGKF